MSLVMFEAPWCPQCHEGRPVLEKTAEERKDVFVASLNCETREANTLCNDEKVEAYPTVRLYRKGKEFVDFMDDITNEKLTKFISDPEGYPALMEEAAKKAEKEKVVDRGLELDALRVDLNQFQAFVTITKNVFIIYYAPWCPRSSELIDLVKKHEEKIKSMRMVLATCNCQIDSHHEPCRKKMTHLPMVEAYFERGLVLNSEKYFKDVIQWNDETFLKLLDGIKEKMEERLELLRSIEPKKSNEDEGGQEGQEGPEGEEGQEGPEGEEGQEGPEGEEGQEGPEGEEGQEGPEGEEGQEGPEGEEGQEGPEEEGADQVPKKPEDKKAETKKPDATTPPKTKAKKDEL